MRILISNDDGYFAPGLLALAEELKKISEVVVVAPERDRSGASNSLTLDRPLVVKHPPGDVISVNGTPTDCVHLAVTGLLEHRPDMVVSGINHGTNMGDDTIYSGTVAAAMEGFLLGIPSIAVSLAGKQGANFAAAAQVAREIVERHQRQAFDGNMLLNVNVPDIPYPKLRGLQVTRLGRRHKAEGIVETVNPRGQTVYWIGPAGSAQDAGEGTDFYAVEHNMVSVTPLQIDLTRYSDVDKTSDWLSADSAVNQLATISKA